MLFPEVLGKSLGDTFLKALRKLLHGHIRMVRNHCAARVDFDKQFFIDELF